MDLVFVIGAFENKNVRYGRVEEPAGSADSWKHVILAINLCRSLMIRVSQSWKWWSDDVTKWHRWLPSSFLEVKLMGNHQLVLSFNHVSLPHGLVFLGTPGVWCKEVCWTRRVSESHYMVYTAQLDKWQLTSELSQLWKATRKSGRQFCFIFFSPLFLSLTPYAGGQQLILGCIHISFYFPPIFFWLLLLLLPFFLPPLLIPIFLFHVRRSRLRREKKKPPQGSDFVAPYTQIRPVPAVTIAASCLLRVCYSRTNERTTSGRARKKEKEKHVGIRSALE